MPVKSTAQFTISDLNDIITGSAAPSSPEVDQLWCDTSTSPPQLKRWNGSSWQVVTDVALTGRVTTAEQKITDSAIINTVTSSPTYLGDKVFVQATAPSNPILNMKWLDTSVTPDQLRIWNGTAWETVGDVQGQLDNMASSITQTAQQITQYVSKADQSRYLSFDATNGVMIGDTTTSYKVQILSNRINILQNSAVIAYFASSRLYITTGELTSELIVGNFSIKKTVDGGIVIG